MADLLALQSDIKRDADGYADDFRLQYRHYKAVLSVFYLHPAQKHEGILELVHFIAQVSSCFPKETKGFAPELMKLLDTHYAVLDPALRRGLVKALILLRNKGQLATTELHPLFFRLFRCQDKALRQVLFRHIVADIKSANQKQRNERLNRSLQNFLYGCLGSEGEAAAKPALAVLTELWRRHVWRDARTANVIASAAFHESPRIMLAAVKFFLGQDDVADNSDDEADDDTVKAVNPTKAEIYNASKKGTVSSKKKKMAKLKRVMAQVKRQDRREKRDTDQNFAAIQLLHDPQSFAEKLFVRLQKSTGEKLETRTAMIMLISRTIGVHKLLLLNFYPFLQRYLQPHQRDVTTLLAALIQACHELVPPDTMTAVLRQLVDAFVHDRARPEVMTLGLKTVRELCARMPLIMNPELLQDLALYKKFRNKEVASAARGLIGMFRELAPAMLEKRDRGRGADVAAAPLSYGASRAASRVEGADLLQEALQRGDLSDEEDGQGDDVSREDSQEAEEEEAADSDEQASGNEDEQQLSGSLAEEESDAEEDESDAGEGGSEPGEEDSEAEEDTVSLPNIRAEPSEGGADGDGGAEEIASDDKALRDGLVSGGEAGAAGADQQDQEERPKSKAARWHKKRKQQSNDPDSLQSLKRQLSEAKAKSAQGADINNGNSAAAAPPQEFLEYGRILTEADFERIRRLRHQHLVEAVMRKHGLKSASKRDRLLAEAEEQAEEALTEQDARAVLGETRVDPDTLTGRHKARKDKAERMESVLEGRADRSYGAAAGRRKKKTGGLSNRQKVKQKNLPQGARAQVMKRRLDASRNRGAGFKGRKSRFR